MEQEFTEIEKKSISIIVLVLIAVDKRLHPSELSSRFNICTKYGIPLSIPQNCIITKPQAEKIVREMSDEKKTIVRDILKELAMADCQLDKSEVDYINQLCQ